MIVHRTLLLALWLLIPMASGCGGGPAIGAGQNTALDAGNLGEITDDMAQKLMADISVQEAIRQQGTLKVVVEPVENNLRAEVLPRGVADAFTARLRVLLSKHNPDAFTWIMNKAAFHSLQKKELERPTASKVDLGPAPEAIQPRYALYAEFRSMADEDAEHRTATYLCVYKLTDLQNRNILWTDQYVLKKVSVKSFLD